MFTGLIERVGVIEKRSPKGGGVELEIGAGGGFEVALGDSVAVNGACLTATRLGGAGFAVDVSSESLGRSTLADARPGGRVNLERALRLGDRMGGHLVTGHVDGLGGIAEISPERGFSRIVIAAPPEVMRLVVEKGSIAVDGVSLTVNGVKADRFELMIIPETLNRTTLAERKPGDAVNLETDLIGKYVERLVGGNSSKQDDNELMKKLMEEGFL